MVISAPHSGKIDQIKVAEGVIDLWYIALISFRTLSILRT